MRRTFSAALLAIAFWMGVAGAARAAGEQTWVYGQEIDMPGIEQVSGSPFVPIDDAGLLAALVRVRATIAWEPGTRFIVLTRADGAIVTFCLGSNAVSINGAVRALPMPPFTQGSQAYLPLLPLMSALSLADIEFPQGYAFVPQLTKISTFSQHGRTVLSINSATPLDWRHSDRVAGGKRIVSLTFPGFRPSVDNPTRRALTRAHVLIAVDGAPGFPTTRMTFTFPAAYQFVALRGDDGLRVSVAVARNAKDIGLSDVPVLQQPAGVVNVAAAATADDVVAVASPAAMPLQVPTATPLGPEPHDTSTDAPPTPATDVIPISSPTDSPTPVATFTPLPQRLTFVGAQHIRNGERLIFAATGPVSFEWHRLGMPDNRYWIDFQETTLIGHAQTLALGAPGLISTRLVQHLVTPQRIVRLTVDPKGPIDVTVRALPDSANNFALDITASGAGTLSPTHGTGTIRFGPMASVDQHAATHAGFIVLDPGHGGNDPGAINSSMGIVEKEVTLGVARLVRADLQRDGWRVDLTRDGDYEVGDPTGSDRQELQARCDVAEAADARVFVSIHVNSSTTTYLNGTTTYYYRGRDAAFARTMQASVIAADGLNNMGVVRDRLYLVNNVTMPAVLVETGYQSNYHDAVLLREPAFLAKLAAGIARGIETYLAGK